MHFDWIFILSFVGGCLCYSYFEDYACVSERAVREMASSATQKKNHITTESLNEISHEYCLRWCQSHNYTFVFHKDARESKKLIFNNCFCFVIDADYTEEVDFSVRVNMFEKCDSESFILSCRVDFEKNWCEKLDHGISYDINNQPTEQNFYRKTENFYPKCVSHEEVVPSKFEGKYENETDFFNRVNHCENNTFAIIDQLSTNCGNGSSIEPTKKVIKLNENCEMCPPSHHHNFTTIYQGLLTCGDEHINSQGLYSVYCSEKWNRFTNETPSCQSISVRDNKSIQILHSDQKLSYFGCFTQPEKDLNLDFTKVVNDSQTCFDNCFFWAKSRNPYPQLLVYIKPYKNGPQIQCYCQYYDRNERLPTITDLSTGCDQSWCPPTPGPCGSFSAVSDEGWALYCQYTHSGENQTDLCVDILGNPERFYPNSPSRRERLETTTERVCPFCEGRYDDRGIFWYPTCAGQDARTNMTQTCPNGTLGEAVWTCDEITLTFLPAEPDRTGCFAEWLDDVESMSKNGSSVKGITEEILVHTSSENITSGTLIRIINVGLELGCRLKGNQEDTIFEESVNITKDYIQIASDLFNQSLAWREMNYNSQSIESFRLIQSNEHMAYKHIGYRVIDDDPNIEGLPYQGEFKDNRGTIELFTSLVSMEQAQSGLPDWDFFKIAGDWFADVEPNAKDGVLSGFGATYSAGLLPPGAYRGDKTVFNGRTDNIVINSNPAIISFSFNNMSTMFNTSTVKIQFQHDNLLHACPQCNRTCVSWDYSSNMFTSTGCKKEKSSATTTTCSCSHLTNFALIFDTSNSDIFSNVESMVLSYMSMILCSLSMLFCVATFVILQVSRLPGSPRISIVKNRSVSLFFLYFFFMVGFDKTQLNGLSADAQDGLCSMFAILIHFFGLSTFTWTLLEGIQLNKSIKSNMLTDIDHRKYTMLMRYLVGYGIPLIIITITLAISYIFGSGTNAYSNQENYCWLRGNDFIYSFVGPAGFVILWNMVVFVKSVRVATEARKTFNNSITDKIIGQVKTWIILSFLLGLTWILGYAIQDGSEGVAFLFVLLNGSSGIFIFIHSVILNEVVMAELKIKLGIDKDGKLAIDNSGSRLKAVKSFRNDGVDGKSRPKIRKRSPRPRSKNDSTSSESVQISPPRRPARSPRRPARKHNVHYNKSPSPGQPTTPDDTSLTSSSRTSQDFTPNRIRAMTHGVDGPGRKVPPDDRYYMYRPEFDDQVIMHERVAQLKDARLNYRHSNKW